MAGGDKRVEALNSGGDFIKVSTSIAVGALVFGLGYFSNSAAVDWTLRLTLAVAALLLILSAILGMLAHSRVPVLINGTGDVHDRLLGGLGIAHQAMLVLGIASLAVSLATLVVKQRPTQTYSVPTADRAIAIARRVIPDNEVILKIGAVDLLKGVDPSDSRFFVWHVQFGVLKKKTSKPAFVDAIVNVEDGRVMHVP